MLLLFSIRGSAQTPTIDDVRLQVSRNVMKFQNQVPNFVRNERITSTAFDQNTPTTTKRVVDSIFSALASVR
jgi:hypothetical protein